MRLLFPLIISLCTILLAGCSTPAPALIPAPGPEHIYFDAKVVSTTPNYGANYMIYEIKITPQKDFGPQKINPYLSALKIRNYEFRERFNNNIKLMSAISYQKFKTFFSDDHSNQYIGNLKTVYNKKGQVSRVNIRPKSHFVICKPEELLVNPIPAKSEPCGSIIDLYYLKWDGKSGEFTSERWGVHSIPLRIYGYDLAAIWEEKYNTGEIVLKIIDSQTAMPIENVELIITEILPAGKLIPEHFGNEFKNKDAGLNIIRSEWLKKWVSDRNKLKTQQPYKPSRRNKGVFHLSIPRVPGKQESLKILLRSDQYKYFEGEVSFDGNMNVEYTVKLPRIGTNLNMQITEPIKSTISRD